MRAIYIFHNSISLGSVAFGWHLLLHAVMSFDARAFALSNECRVELLSNKCESRCLAKSTTIYIVLRRVAILILLLN